MKTKYAAGVILTGLVCVGTSSAQSGGAEVKAPPNIVFIMADDLGFSDLGCYGGEAATPNLDRLAAEGVRFSQYYNCGKCEPTRAALMTGHRNTPQIGFLAERAKTFMPAVLKDQGYRTILAGKWHVSRHPLDRGFERFFGMEEGACDYYTGSGRLQLVREKFPVPAAGFYTTDAFTDHALKFLDEAKTQNDAQPFFLYLAYDTPHAAIELPTQAYPAGGGLKGGLQWLGTPGHIINTASGTVDSWVHPDYAAAE
ncbi:MAG: sulfatase-like hydrolase/transferase, partial [Kiritimatiellales bacterium]